MQRELEAGLRQTLETLVRGRLTEAGTGTSEVADLRWRLRRASGQGMLTPRPQEQIGPLTSCKRLGSIELESVFAPRQKVIQKSDPLPETWNHPQNQTYISVQ